jgi:hypothetical protein
MKIWLPAETGYLPITVPEPTFDAVNTAEDAAGARVSSLVAVVPVVVVAAAPLISIAGIHATEQ